MTILARGRYRAYEAEDAGDLAAARGLRAAVFPADRGGGDEHDARCRHMLVEDLSTGRAICTFRTLSLRAGAEVGASYSARFYRLDALKRMNIPMIEVGRLCIRAGALDADILRVAWGALARQVEEEGAGFLFGCTSFNGTSRERYRDAFELLAERFLAPARWRPRIGAARAIVFRRPRAGAADTRRAMVQMPSLLRTYLAMGGRVSDHAVIDEEMGTLHVFTGVEVKAIPPARRRLLHALAG